MSDRARFSCPQCGRPFTAGAQVLHMKVQCPDCSNTFTAEPEDPYKIRLDEPLDRAYERVVEALQEEGHEIHPLKGFNESGDCSGYAKFIVTDEEEAPKIHVLGTAEWNNRQEQQVIAQLLTMWDAFLRKAGTFPQVRFLTAHDPGPLAQYAFSNEPGGIFETLCMIRFRAPYAVEPAHAREIAHHVQQVLKNFWNVEIDPEKPEDAKRLEDFIVRQLRGSAGPEETIEGMDYWPRHTLLGLGCLLGEVLCRHPKLVARWVRDEEVPFQLGIEVGLRGSPQVQYSDPIGKICMLFEDGAANSVEAYVRDLPEVLGELSQQA